MADFGPPSFSLGLDFDLDSQPQQEPVPNLSLNGNAESAERSSGKATRLGIQEDRSGGDEDFETPSIVLDPQVSEPSRSLKRLRRGPTSEPTLAARKIERKVEWVDVDEEIEEFSEEDQHLDGAKKHQYSLCSSSKLPLHGHGLLPAQSSKQLKGSKKKETENASASADTEAATNKLVFPKLTVSPLRKFQLIDSDSDEAFLDEGFNNKVNQVDSSSNDKDNNLSQVTAATDLKKAKGSASLPQNEDLWKDICPQKNFSVPTPALDEVCEEYFRSVKDRNKFQNHLEGFETDNSDKSNEQQCSFSPFPPAHHYYFHEDPRIREIVHARLPNFFPLGSGSSQGDREQDACTIDYMRQFNHGEAVKPAKQKEVTKPSTSRSKKNAKNPKDQELSQGSERWVNPRSSGGIPKDAGKRRIQAVGKSAGRWYTASDGSRVYVSTNGQELTGQIAYRQYRRESGAGFSRSKKKVAPKKKAAAKKK